MVLNRVGVLVLFLLALIGSGCERNTEPVKIGLSINLSGRGGAAGEDIRDGALLAVEEINGKGGIHGRPMKLLIRDDENSDAGVQKADQSLINEGVVAIIGHSYSSNTLKGYPLITASNTLMITAYTATTKLTGRDDLFLRTSVDCQLYGQKTADLLEKKGVSKVSFLIDTSNAAFVLDYANQVEKYYQGSIEAIVKFGVRDDIDWQRVTSELLAPSPEAIIMLTESSMTAMAAQNVRNQGFAGPVIATIWTQSPDLMHIGGPATEGISIVTFISPENRRPDYLEFSRKMEEKFNKKATARSSRAYEMMYILAKSLRQVEKINAVSLKKAILEGEFESILGTVRFDQYGDVVRPVYEVVVKDGKFVNGGEI